MRPLAIELSPWVLLLAPASTRLHGHVELSADGASVVFTLVSR
jgi:hypothetical protein